MNAETAKIQTLQQPSLICLKNEQGNEYKYLLKQDEDARKDMHVMSFCFNY